MNLAGTTHTNAGTTTDTWTFTDATGNYNNQSGTVNDSIAKANATLSVTGYTTIVGFSTLPVLERTIAQRAAERPEGSYTAALLAEPAHAGAKVEEEAEEVVRAAREESDERVAEEAADVLYHLAVLMRSRGLSLADAERVLDGRRGG